MVDEVNSKELPGTASMLSQSILKTFRTFKKLDLSDQKPQSRSALMSSNDTTHWFHICL